MFESFVLGVLGQSSLVISGLLVYVARFPARFVGLLGGFGAGSLIGAIAFDLLPDAEELPHLESAAWLFIGAGVFVVADELIERVTERGTTASNDAAASSASDDSTASATSDESDDPLGIVVGSIVDGVPESIIFGIGIATLQPVSLPFLFAVWISNFPQAIVPSAELAAKGWARSRMTLMWSAVVLACGAAAALGYVFGAVSADAFGGRAAALASGGLLAMLTNSLVPFSYERAGAMAGIGTVVGFALALAAS